jgi:hypothetical protein
MLLNLPAPMTPTRMGLPSFALALSIRYRFILPPESICISIGYANCPHQGGERTGFLTYRVKVRMVNHDCGIPGHGPTEPGLRLQKFGS